jgi:hypothetical protein
MYEKWELRLLPLLCEQYLEQKVVVSYTKLAFLKRFVLPPFQNIRYILAFFLS